MGRQEFGRLVERHMREQGISQGRLAVRLGELGGGRYFDTTGVRQILKGARVIDPELLERLVELLGMDRDEAYLTLGLAPPDLTLEELRELREGASERTAARAKAASRVAAPEGATVAAAPVLTEQGEPEILYLLNRLERPAA
jgi:transcriptional regulator with XRE-family HTH domain